jgi:glutamate N-acetyltransferase/amino-acid N-acetyltransferase
MTLRINGVTVFESGHPLPDALAEAEKAMCERDVTLDLALGAGDERATVWTSDLSHEYVSINADYTT